MLSRSNTLRQPRYGGSRRRTQIPWLATMIGRGHWVLASCQVSSNSVLRANEEDKLKIFGQSETRVAIFGFGLARKTQAY